MDTYIGWTRSTCSTSLDPMLLQLCYGEKESDKEHSKGKVHTHMTIITVS